MNIYKLSDVRCLCKHKTTYKAVECKHGLDRVSVWPPVCIGFIPPVLSWHAHFKYEKGSPQ